jgi:hypothetical protein
MRAAIARGKNGMRSRLHEPDVSRRHGEIRALLATTRETPSRGLEQSAIARGRHLCALHTFRRCNRRSGFCGGAEVGALSRTPQGGYLRMKAHQTNGASRLDPEFASQERANPVLWVVFHVIALWSAAGRWLRFKRICAWHEPKPRRLGGNPLARRSTHGLCPECFARVSCEIISHGEKGLRVSVTKGKHPGGSSLPAPPARKCAIPARLQRPSAGDLDTARPAILRGKTFQANRHK